MGAALYMGLAYIIMMARLFTPLEGVLREVEPIRPSDTVSRAASRMYDERLPVLPVADEGRYLGVVTYISLLKSRLAGQARVEKALLKVPPAPRGAEEAVKEMLRAGVPGLAYLEDGSPVAVVTAAGLLRALSTGRLPPTRELMKRVLAPLRGGDRLDKARKLLVKLSVPLLPVVSGEKLSGVVDAYSLLALLYTTPLERRRLGEVHGDIEYFLGQPVAKAAVDSYRRVELDGTPRVDDVAEGAVVVNANGWPVGVLEPYTTLRRLFPLVEEASLPLRVEGVDGLDFFERGLIWRKALDVASSVARRGRLLDMSVVIKEREKAGDRARYDASVTIRLDRGVHTGKASAWSPIDAAAEALSLAYESFKKEKDRRRTRRIERARRRKLEWR